MLTHKNTGRFPVVITYSMNKWDNASKFAMEDFCGGDTYSITADVCSSKTSHDEEVNCKEGLIGKLFFFSCLFSV